MDGIVNKRCDAPDPHTAHVWQSVESTDPNQFQAFCAGVNAQPLLAGTYVVEKDGSIYPVGQHTVTGRMTYDQPHVEEVDPPRTMTHYEVEARVGISTEHPPDGGWFGARFSGKMRHDTIAQAREQIIDNLRWYPLYEYRVVEVRTTRTSVPEA